MVYASLEFSITSPLKSSKAERLRRRDRVLVPDRLRVGQDRVGPGDLPGDEPDEVAVRGVGRLEPARAAEMRP